MTAGLLFGIANPGSLPTTGVVRLCTARSLERKMIKLLCERRYKSLDIKSLLHRGNHGCVGSWHNNNSCGYAITSVILKTLRKLTLVKTRKRKVHDKINPLIA